MGQLNYGYYDDNRMKVARKLPSQDLIAFFQMKLLNEEKNIAELAMKLPETDILEFLQMKLLKDEINIVNVAERLPHDEFLQFWNLGLIYDLELVIPIIKGIPDELLVMYIKETDDFDLKEIFANAIHDKQLRKIWQNELRIYRENETIVASLEKICIYGTIEQKHRMQKIITGYQNLESYGSKTLLDD